MYHVLICIDICIDMYVLTCTHQTLYKEQYTYVCRYTNALSGQSEHTIGEVCRNCQCSGVVGCNEELPHKASGIRCKYAPAVMGSSSLPWR